MGSKVSKPLPVESSTTTKSLPVVNNDSVKEGKVETPQNMPKDHIHMNLSNGTQAAAAGGGGGCPMKKNGGGYFGWKWFGGGGSKEEHKIPKEKIESKSTSSSANGGGEGGGCPVKHKNNDKQSVQYNVYSQPIDPKNNMPSVANQLPSPSQEGQLSTTRVKSTIPKGGSGGETWTYPSPQMFYNSLARKNKLGDTEESDVESVVALHNNMNEKTWYKVMQWEKVLDEDGQRAGGSKLLKFLGRPSDLSPKARIKNLLFGYPLPFDRHDWTVVRPNGEEVRYVIDYYYDETRASETEGSGMPDLHDRDAVKSILVDVRPAADNIQNAFGRVFTMPMSRHILKNTEFETLPLFPTKDLKEQVHESEKVWANIQKSVEQTKAKSDPKSMVLKEADIPEEQREGQSNNVESADGITDSEAKEIALSFASMLTECGETQKLVDSCKDEKECAQASLALTMCLAKIVCPVQQNAVAKAINADDVDPNDEKAVAAYNATFDAALENMAICVNLKSQKAKLAKKSYPQFFQNA